MKNIIISIACSIFFIICVGATIILFPKVKEETIAYSTSIEDLFEKEGHFYVYFNRKECPYCDNIEDDIKQFKKENAVYEIDAEACKGTRNYDWDSHEKKYDVEIGEKDSTGKIVFYDGLDENLIKEKYPPIHYKIIWANENYAALHEGKEAGKVYAISTHPNIKKAPSGTMSMDLRPGRSAVKHFGHWRSSSIQHTRSAFIP